MDPSSTGHLPIDLDDVPAAARGHTPPHVSIEFAWWSPPDDGPAGDTTVVLLHEGLGSVAQWRGVPGEVAAATRCPVFAFNRFGYGASTPAEAGFAVDFMHTEGLHVLPRVLDQADISRHVLVGHSDGGSISLIAAGGGVVDPVGVMVIAPHIYVEAECAAGIVAIEARRDQIVAGLTRYHQRPDLTFAAWNDVWLDPDFQRWDIRQYLPGIDCPVLAVQGADDEYATDAMITGIDEAVPDSRGAVLIPDCGHIAHRDQPEAVTELIVGFVRSVVA